MFVLIKRSAIKNSLCYYTPTLQLLVSFLAGKMNLKNNRICMKIIEEICNKYDSGKEFVDNRIKELCIQDGILINEVRTWFKFNLFFF